MTITNARHRDPQDVSAEPLVADLVSALVSAFDSPDVIAALARGGVPAGDSAAAAAALDEVSLAVLGACEESFRAAVKRALLPRGGQ